MSVIVKNKFLDGFPNCTTLSNNPVVVKRIRPEEQGLILLTTNTIQGPTTLELEKYILLQMVHYYLGK